MPVFNLGALRRRRTLSLNLSPLFGPLTDLLVLWLAGFFGDAAVEALHCSLHTTVVEVVNHPELLARQETLAFVVMGLCARTNDCRTLHLGVSFLW